MSEKQEIGNGAKMREALLEITRQLEPIVKYMHPNKAEHIGLTTVFAACEPIYKIAKAALAAPPRNCDVGTAREQKMRMSNFCKDRHCDDCVFRCTLDCRFDWAQMPYEEGGAK